VNIAIDPTPALAGAGLLPHERRRKNRIQVRIPLRIIGKSPVGQVSQDGVCLDISESGVSFEANVDLYVGEIVDLQFRQRDAGRLNFQVRLLYKVGNRYGGYFLSGGRRPGCQKNQKESPLPCK